VDVPGARPEVWAVGLRNPWRFAFDPPTGSLWIADVGQVKWEEIDRVPLDEAAGANFGWNLYEGRQCFERESCDPAGVTFPILVYPHDGVSCAVVGGPVYRGPVGRLNGQFLAGDYCSGKIWTVDPDRPALELQVDTNLLITSFGEAADGSVYVTGQGGELMRVVGVD
jgi:glucose/arabinose dehydrogenase